jgi:hypothetical protein
VIYPAEQKRADVLLRFKRSLSSTHRMVEQQMLDAWSTPPGIWTEFRVWKG